jgi:hypothetical protein
MHSKGAIATRLIALALLASPLPPARGAAELKVGEDGSFSAGLGLRTSLGESVVRRTAARPPTTSRWRTRYSISAATGRRLSKFKDQRVAAPRDDIGQLVLSVQLLY